MDTKLKKFSRSKVTKAVSFVLALVFFTAAALSCFGLFFGAVRDTEKRDVLSAYLTGSGYQLIQGEKFKNELLNYCETAVKTKLVYKSGLESEYESFKAATEEHGKKAISKKVQEISRELKAQSGTANFYSLLGYLESKEVTLKRLADHTCYIKSGVSLFQSSSSAGYVADSDGEIYDSYYDYLDGIESDDETEGFAETTMPSNSVVTSATATFPHNSGSESTILSKKTIPESVRKKATNPENIIEICSLCNTDTNATFDGYYEFFIDESKIDVYNLSDNDDYGVEAVKNYSAFKQKAELYKNEFSRLSSHISIIISNENSGKIVFSNSKAFNASNSSLDEAASAINSAPFGFAYTLASGNFVEFGKGTSNDSTVRSNIYEICTTLNNDFSYLNGNFKLYVSTDSFFSNEKLLSSAGSSHDTLEALLSSSAAAQSEVRSGIFKAAVFLFLFLLLTVYLILVSGKRPEDNEVHPARADKIFTLLRTALDLGISCAAVIYGLSFAGSFATQLEKSSLSVSTTACYAVLGVLSAVAAALLLDWLLFLSRHIKNRTLFKNLFVVWLSEKLCGKIKVLREKRSERPVAYKDIFNDALKKVALFVLLPNIVIGLPCLFAVSNDHLGGWFFGLLLTLYDLAVLGYAVYYVFCVRKVFFTLEEMRKGNHTVSIDTARMPQAVKSAAANAMNLGEGLHAAVENAVKEEKMKAELITNVSHDLKTPLTSIINYTDLLSRCNITDETAKSYIGVLKEKSERLKKLIEDLVEASKASSGAMKVELMKVSLNELALQLEGEYEDEFEARGLELVSEGTENEIFILADPKLCHRVLDNLLGNIKKYAMKNTRVYLTLKREPGSSSASITLKNISEGRLNISPQELKARFVRGDASRTSEGNGLGLSIADNLCSLQGGKLDIEIIGDLFCATVTFRAAP